MVTFSSLKHFNEIICAIFLIPHYKFTSYMLWKGPFIGLLCSTKQAFISQQALRKSTKQAFVSQLGRFANLYVFLTHQPPPKRKIKKIETMEAPVASRYQLHIENQ
ncbi:hypothetical protein AMTRI_Chr13g123340 [Amborella trichopoda]